MFSTLLKVNFGSSQLGHTIQMCIKFQAVMQRHDQFQFFRKGSGTSFPTTFCICFFKKNNSLVIFF